MPEQRDGGHIYPQVRMINRIVDIHYDVSDTLAGVEGNHKGMLLVREVVSVFMGKAPWCFIRGRILHERKGLSE